jgi:hypothetical protein
VTQSVHRSGVRDELVTALMSVNGSLGLLHSGAGGALPPAAKELVSIAVRNCSYLTSLVEELFDID